MGTERLGPLSPLPVTLDRPLSPHLILSAIKGEISFTDFFLPSQFRGRSTPQLSRGRTEAQRGRVPHPRSHSDSRQDLRPRAQPGTGRQSSHGHPFMGWFQDTSAQPGSGQMQPVAFSQDLLVPQSSLWPYPTWPRSRARPQSDSRKLLRGKMAARPAKARLTEAGGRRQEAARGTSRLLPASSPAMVKVPGQPWVDFTSAQAGGPGQAQSEGPPGSLAQRRQANGPLTRTALPMTLQSLLTSCPWHRGAPGAGLMGSWPRPRLGSACRNARCS